MLLIDSFKLHKREKFAAALVLISDKVVSSIVIGVINIPGVIYKFQCCPNLVNFPFQFRPYSVYYINSSVVQTWCTFRFSFVHTQCTI
jgi:hypothetical protein